MTSVPCCIIGGGPAGLSAAIYTARAGIETLVLGCQPKVAGDYDIDNYFGFDETISGRDLIARGVRQASRFGATLECERVLTVHHADSGEGFHIKTVDREIECQALIIAAGVSRLRPGVRNLDDYEGKGVSYCVSCDGFFYRNRPVAVLGEGFFAANQALELLNYTPNVRLFTQGKTPTFSQEFSDRLEKAGIVVSQEKIDVLEGEPALSAVVLESGESIPLDGLFIAMGEASALDFANTLGLTRRGVFIDAESDQTTNIPGVFAAGDCVGRFLQISVAVGEGALAGRSAINYLKKK
ncbi:NAD(P)/FAD-dependent oxidoreductase [Desulfovibrio inopinatus]|uniref:NAD(P)/FAD-dependent oxidoreductase n=1 Tax=Desulfovibrio inopinatus TaxID=102109 RepID=UPI00040626B2|nr:NAD(P)/FAD-dependent oxidoreductase [Desulfovibrio inopinatus]